MLLLAATAELVVVDRAALGNRHVPPAGLVGAGDCQVAVDAQVDERRATAGQRALDRGAHLVGPSAASVWMPNARPIAAKSGE